MTIIYKHSKYLNVRVPVLHKVVYDRRLGENVPAKFQRSLLDVNVDAWLEENCEYGYYHSPGYIHEKFIEFEDDKEAFMFALRFGR
jgi:hypothetical protein